MAKFTLQLITLNYRETILSTDLIQYNTIVYWHSPGGAFQWQCDYKKTKKKPTNWDKRSSL